MNPTTGERGGPKGPEPTRYGVSYSAPQSRTISILIHYQETGSVKEEHLIFSRVNRMRKVYSIKLKDCN